MKNNDIKISKFLSLVLRHQPQLINITLDENGWTDVDILIRQSNKKDMHLDFQLLKHIVDTNPKKRFAFNEEMSKIRASQGHSVNINLGYENQKPPTILFHGTAIQNVDSILKNGLEKRNRQHVHLSTSKDTATKVAQRHGKPYIFNILAEQMHSDGFEFYLSDNNVWLTDHVPAKYIKKEI